MMDEQTEKFGVRIQEGRKGKNQQQMIARQ
jgi:hypothetical protein